MPLFNGLINILESKISEPSEWTIHIIADPFSSEDIAREIPEIPTRLKPVDEIDYLWAQRKEPEWSQDVVFCSILVDKGPVYLTSSVLLP